MDDRFYIQADFSEVGLPPDGEGTIAIIPREAVRLERIIIPADIARLLAVSFIAVAGAPQLKAIEGGSVTLLPGGLFTECYGGARVVAPEDDDPAKCYCPPRHLIEVRLRNTTARTLRVSGCQAILRRPDRIRPPREFPGPPTDQTP
ncbi:MAG: hypothetical protein IT377_31050 [Polyangiaceae bacterium]|nr:hypothetical protein [Polyangiaceae bacterium]